MTEHIEKIVLANRIGKTQVWNRQLDQCSLITELITLFFLVNQKHIVNQKKQLFCKSKTQHNQCSSSPEEIILICAF